MRDNTLVASIKSLGHDVSMIPMYTPLRVDEESVSEKHVFYGGIEAYLLQKFPRKTVWRDSLIRLAGSQALVRLLPHFDIGSAVDPAQNAELTLSMLRGENGNQNSLLDEIVNWLSTSLQPDLVHITNTLISGPARAIKQSLNVPIVCGLHGEDIFIEGLPEPYRSQALDLIRENAAYIDHFIAISQYYADYFGNLVGIDPAKISLVRPGIALQDFRYIPDTQPSTGPLTIGYLARISPEKGLHILVDAFINLCKSGKFPGLRLKVAGYLSRAHMPYVKQIQQQINRAGISEQVEILGTVNREQKLSFLSSLDVFSLPTIYRDPKGLPVLEALASGVPVVQPNHGAFPELVNATGGGLLHTPEDPIDLSEKLATLLHDVPLRQLLNRQGRTAVYNHFSAERMATETLAVYQNFTG
ncbi:MAG: glycosyltransferase family 4 protein [Chloroflexi bacterium]|nr:glycosyltransferase family 4 protein [Chloroflexota bacterium]